MLYRLNATLFPPPLLPTFVQSSLPLFLGLAAAGGGFYYAKESGYLDQLLGAAPGQVGRFWLK